MLSHKQGIYCNHYKAQGTLRREGGKNADPEDGEDRCKRLSSSAAWLLCYHSQSTKDGVPQHSCTEGGKGLMMMLLPEDLLAVGGC